MKGEPAFPNNFLHSGYCFGLTKREFYAVLAMQGYLAMRANPDFDLKKFSSHRIARDSVEMADALIEELQPIKTSEGDK